MIALVVHPEHPGALAVLDGEGKPQFVTAARVVEMFGDLQARVERLERNGKLAVDAGTLSALVCDAGGWVGS